MIGTAAMMAAQALAASFGLVCAGSERAGPIGLALPEADGIPVRVEFRIDLEGRRWCEGRCATTEPIAGEIGGVLLLRDRHHPGGSHVILLSAARDGFTDTRIEGEAAILRSGRCETAPFRGFPVDIAGRMGRERDS